MIPFLQYDQTFVTTYHQELLNPAPQMTSVRMVENAVMISAKVRTVKSIVGVQKVLDIGVEDTEAEEVEAEEAVLEGEDRLEEEDRPEEEAHYLGKRKPV